MADGLNGSAATGTDELAGGALCGGPPCGDAVDVAGTGCAVGGAEVGAGEEGVDCAAQNAQDKQNIATRGTAFEIRIVPVFK